MRAADVMQKGVISVSPELALRDFEELLASEEISGTPVIGSQGDVVGIVSQTDVVRALSDEQPLADLFSSDLRVEDIMTRDVLCAAPDDDVRDVARRMIDGSVHRVLVRDGDEVIGIVTTLDLLRAFVS